MAEELDIRSIWNKGKAQEDPSSLPINMMEKKGTKTTLYWIKTILWIEFWISIALGPVMVFYFAQHNNPIGFPIAYGVIVVLYLFYYQFLIRKINAFNYDRNVIESLKKVYGYLRFYLIHYKIAIWLSVVMGIVYGFYAPQYQEIMQKIETKEQWISIIVFTTLWMSLIGGILHLVVHLIYGRKIKRLRTTVKELENEG